MKVRGACAALAALVAAFATTAEAQVVGIVTTPAGSLANSVGNAIAKVATEKGGVRTTVQVQQSLGMEPINAGTADISVTSSIDLTFFVTGNAYFEGNGKKENIRLIARLMPLMAGVMVRKDSSIRTLKDLKGKRIAAEFGAQKSSHRVFEGYLANGGLTYNDVQKVLARNVNGGADDFAAGKTDAFVFAMGTAKVKEVNSSVGGIRALPIDLAPDALARMQKLLPGSYPYFLQPSPQMEEVAAPTNVIAYDYLLFTNAKMSADAIYKITKSMHGNKDSMVATFAGFRLFEPSAMAIAYEGLQYHPGAEKLYKEAGMWPPKKPGT